MFITPVAPDLFSLYSFDNLATWFSKWGRTYSRAVAATHSENDDVVLAPLMMSETGAVRVVFGGYTTQEYLTKYTEGKARSVLAYDKYKIQIPIKATALARSLSSPELDLDLGVVPYMFSMVPLAQSAHAPIFELKGSDGLNGAQFNQQSRYSKKLASIGDRLASHLGLNTQDKAAL
jgi:hypothetical protein